MARRGHADAPPAPHQLGDEPRARPRLPRAGRPLDEEVARIELDRERALLGDVGRLDARAGLAAADARRRSREDVAQRPIAAVARQHRRREPRERVLLRIGVVRAARDQRARHRHVVEARTATKRQRARGLIDGDDRPRRLSSWRDPSVLSPALSLYCCGGNRQRVDQRLLVRSRRRPSGTRPPIDSASSSSSSSVIFSQRSKNHHHAGRASRR